MSIKNISGDILTFDKGYLVHQVNHAGSMGAGLSLAVVERYPKILKPYREFCKKYSWDLIKCLGLVHFWQANDSPLFIANVFGQEKYGTHSRQTDYVALFHGLYTVKAWAMYHKDVLPIAIPHGLGCGLGGGNWDHVHTNIIFELFGAGRYPEVFIYKL